MEDLDRVMAKYKAAFSIAAKSKGLAKLGNIAAETMFLVMFPGVAKLGNVCFGAKFVSGKQKLFWLQAKTFFVFRAAKFVSATAKLGNICIRNSVSATMFPSLARP